MVADSHSTLRPTQRAILADYTGGRMGISAVPGSGKTFTLSMLASDIVLSGDLDLDQEVLIVTLSNSAVDNFSQRIGQFLEQAKMLPGLGYRVRTLHGLAHDIVRERPSLVNLANDFSIIDEGEANAIREQVALAWLRANPYFFDSYLDPELSEYKLDNIRAQRAPALVQNTSLSFIRYAKDRELTPDALRRRLDELPAPLPLAEMGCAIYQEYQRSLSYRGAVDFDDLIRLALAALRADPNLVTRLRAAVAVYPGGRGPGFQPPAGGNPAPAGRGRRALGAGGRPQPGHLRDLYHRQPAAPDQLYQQQTVCCARSCPFPGARRNSIIPLANHLIDWTREEHPLAEAREALHLPHIQPTEPGRPAAQPAG